MKIKNKDYRAFTIDLDHIDITYDLEKEYDYRMVVELLTKLDYIITSQADFPLVITISLPVVMMRENLLVVTQADGHFYTTLHSRSILSTLTEQTGMVEIPLEQIEVLVETIKDYLC